ncbi:MAG: family 10 glycosylhydrolase [Bacteroidales bacterium]|nr:family 10 glycosylhydrolase [Bacteroidales bacterium]
MRKLSLSLLGAAVMASLACCSTKKASEFKPTDKPALMWIDAEGNYARFNHKDTIDKYVDMLADLGFTHLAVDARPISGELMYDSELAPRFHGMRIDTPPDSTFDYLGYFIEKAKERDMKVLFSLNVFCAGHNFFDKGLIFTDHPEWASIVQDPEKGLVPITELKHRSDKYGGMVNPINPEYQDYIINVMKEMLTKYPEVDGLIIDRGRYDGIMADFSDLSRSEFEKFIGKPVKTFPDDILKIVRTESGRDSIIKGEYFTDWIYWRSKNIHDFFARARKEVKDINPETVFSTYSGAWYPSYYEVGVNFASNQYDPSKEFSWANDKYKETGYAELIDMYITGNYYTDITIEDFENNPDPIWNETDFEGHTGDWYCVEGSCHHLRDILGPNKFLGGLLVDQLYDKPVEPGHITAKRLPEAMAMNVKESDGLMIFDICHIINAGLWDEVREGMELSGYIPAQENK